jgi:hypothetical protein
MLAFCLDHPAPATIILVSGDRDFAYAMSVLRHRQYQMVLVAPAQPTAHVTLRAQASLVLDWTSDVLGHASFEASSTQASSSKTKVRGASEASQVAPHLGPCVPDTSVDNVAPPETYHPGPPLASTPLGSARGTSQSHAIVPESRLQSPSPICEAPINIPQNPYEIASHRRQGSFAATICSSELADHSTSAARNSPSPHALFEEPGRLSDDSVPKFYSSTFNTSSERLDLSSKFGEPTCFDAPPNPRPADSAAAAAPLTSANGVASSGLSEMQRVRVTTTAHQRGSLPFVADRISTTPSRVKFRPLVEKLTQLYQQGARTPLRSVVGSQLDRKIYQEAGVVTFGEYVELAKKSNIVELGGVGGNSWIALAPFFPTQQENKPQRPSVSTPLLHNSHSPSMQSHAGLIPGSPSTPGSILDAYSLAPTSPPFRRSSSLPRAQGVVALSRLSAPSGAESAPLHEPSPRVASTSDDLGTVTAPGTSPLSRMTAPTHVASTTASLRPSAVQPNRRFIFLTEDSLLRASTLEHACVAPPSLARFQPLITTLREFHLNGVMQPSRSDLGTRLVEVDRLVYSKAGVTRLREYVALALQANIVEIGGKGNNQWISLANK